MKTQKWFYVLMAAAVLFIAGVTSADAREGRSFQAGRLSVMTQNLYVGGDILLPLSATSPEDFLEKAALVIGQILTTDYPQRAMKLAELIGAERPHLVGLQEVYVIRLCLDPALTICPVDLDYLDILLANLNAEEALYTAAASVTNIDLAGLPAVLPDGTPIFVGLTDRDVIIARADVETRNPVGENFAAALPVDNPLLPGFDRVLRGYTMVDATVKGREYRFVNTHLEVSGGGSELGPFFRAVQAAQAAELATVLGADDHVQVVVGDFNSSAEDGPFVDCLVPDGSGGFVPDFCPTPYYVMGLASYIDVWNERRGPWIDGDTCCQDTLLDNPVSDLNERIDLVWVRQAPDHYGGPVVRGVRADVIGEEEGDRTLGGLWPSDHAGVSAAMTLRVPR
ncbi:MAG: hypothetical protein P8172_10870 [Gammaproteobacteria bacterium]